MPASFDNMPRAMPCLMAADTAMPEAPPAPDTGVNAWATMLWADEFDVDLAGTATLDYGDGVWGTVHWGYTAAYGAPLVAVGTQARLTAPHGWRPPAGEPALYLDVGDETTPIYVERVDDYVGEVRDLSLAVRGAQAPAYGWEPLDATMRVLDACFASDKSGRAEPV